MPDLLRFFRRRCDVPAYSLGPEWTPTPQQIADSRERLRGRRAANCWQAVTVSHRIDDVRIPILFATEASNAEPERIQQLRTIRALAFDADARFFVRKLVVSPEHSLIEFRHPKLRHHDESIPVGLRFIGLGPGEWQHGDCIGTLLDGRPLPFERIFGPGWVQTFRDPNLVESYIQFVFDHAELNGDQVYVVSSMDDFIATSTGVCSFDSATPLTAQFCFDVHREQLGPAAAAEQSNGSHSAPQQPPRLPAHMLDEALLIPPTYLRTVPSDGKAPEQPVVFATIVYLGHLHHVCLKISPDGKIDSLQQSLRTREKGTLPITPLRSFKDQKASIIRALRGADQEEPP